MKKAYETPVLQTETFDVENVITASAVGTRTGTWETNQVSTETLTGMGFHIH